MNLHNNYRMDVQELVANTDIVALCVPCSKMWSQYLDTLSNNTSDATWIYIEKIYINFVIVIWMMPALWLDPRWAISLLQAILPTWRWEISIQISSWMGASRARKKGGGDIFKLRGEFVPAVCIYLQLVTCNRDLITLHSDLNVLCEPLHI